MTYKKVKFNLSDSQKNRIKLAYANKESVGLRLNKSNIDVRGYELLLTENEYNKLSDGKTHNITLPYSRSVKNGGFLPFLLPLLGVLGAAAGASAGIATTVANAKKAQAAEAEKQAELARKKLYEDEVAKQKSGSGVRTRKTRKVGVLGIH